MVRVTLLIVVLGVLAACGGPLAVAIQEAWVTGDGMRVELVLNSCNGDYEVAVSETPDVVRIDVTDHKDYSGLGRDACASSVRVNLSEPLGDRELRGTGGRVINSVRFEP